MPTKLNSAGKQQEYIPKGNGDASGEYGTSKGTNKNFTKPNIISENKVLTPTKATKIENMNEMQLDSEIESTQRAIDRLNKIMGNNKMSDDLSKDFPLGVGGSGWSAERKKQFSKNIERDTQKAKNYVDAYNERESLQNRLDALNKAKEQVKGTDKTQSQIKQDAISNTESTLNWEKGKMPSPYGKGEINVIKANGYEIRSVDSGFFAIYKDGKQLGFSNKLKDAKALVEKSIARQTQANVIK